MKRNQISILVISLFLMHLLAGCSFYAYTDYYRDIEEYSEVWELEGFSYGFDGEVEALTVFPEKIIGLKVNDYYCRHDQILPLGKVFRFI